MAKALDIIQVILIIFLIVFGIFILYQIIRKILGGSWDNETIIISLLIFNISFTIAIALNLIKFNTDYNYFKKYMHNFAKDFREFKEKMSEKLNDIKSKL